uniref:Uncharacterized protein n=1 Tax=Arundo donax TaxID=35708 RepID=A0A0A8Z5U9_ARUDO
MRLPNLFVSESVVSLRTRLLLNPKVKHAGQCVFPHPHFFMQG